MFKNIFTLFLVTASFADLGGIPDFEMESSIYGELWSADVYTSVYTDDDQQDYIGVPDDALLITYTIVNHEDSMSDIEDIDIFVGAKDEDQRFFAIPGYLPFSPEERDQLSYNAPDYVDYSYETGLYNWDWGTEGNFGLRPGEYAVLFVLSYSDSFIFSPGIAQGEGEAGIFVTMVPDLNGSIIPAPSVLGLLGLSFVSRRRSRQ
tara:strand:+ start:331 stop:945 length:615 start_codon:yes stop_codon:yes gene_type:complete